jgi:hypothetical protein
MKKFIKKLICYDKIYESFKDSIFYQVYKKYRAKLAAELYNHPSKDLFVI